MSTVNFNDTVPAPPANFSNLKWQSDTSGNISAYDPGGTWTNWTPTVTPVGGSMALSATTLADAQYLRVGALVFVKIAYNFTVSGSGGTLIQFTLPLPVAGSYSMISGMYYSTPTAAYGMPTCGNVNNTSNFIGLTPNAANFTAGAYLCAITGFYRCA